MNQNQQNPAPESAPPAVEQQPSARAEISNLQKEIEQKIFSNNRILWTSVSDWISEKGSQLQPPLNLNLWESDSATRDRDLDRIFEQFPEFQTSTETFVSPEKKAEFAQILSRQFLEEEAACADRREELVAMSEEVGASTTERLVNSLQLGERFDSVADSFKKVFSGRAGPEDYRNVVGTGACLFVAFNAIKYLWGVGWDTLTGGESRMLKFLGVAGVGAAAIFGVRALTNPETADAAEIENSDALSAFPALENLRNKEGTKEFLALIDVPTETVLAEYEKPDVAQNRQIDPKILRRFVSGTADQKKWQREMIDQINPANLFAVVHSTVEVFAGSREFQNRADENQTVTDWLREKYVTNSASSIEFSRLWMDAREMEDFESPVAESAEQTSPEEESDQTPPPQNIPPEQTAV